MITLTLCGRLACFGPTHLFDVSSLAEAIHALTSQSDDFFQQIAGTHLLCERKSGSGFKIMDMANCIQPLQKAKIRITPAISGQNETRGKMIFGLSLLGLSFLPGGSVSAANLVTQQSGSLLTRGLLGTAASFVLQRAAADRLSPQRFSRVGQTPSSLVQAPTNSNAGMPVPLLYGRVRMQTPPIISSGLSVETRSS